MDEEFNLPVAVAVILISAAVIVWDAIRERLER